METITLKVSKDDIYLLASLLTGMKSVKTNIDGDPLQKMVKHVLPTLRKHLDSKSKKAISNSDKMVSQLIDKNKLSFNIMGDTINHLTDQLNIPRVKNILHPVVSAKASKKILKHGSKVK